MKKLRFTNSTLLLILLLFATACEGLFVPDPIDPRIPKYTAEGNEVAGAYVNDDIWESVVSYKAQIVGSLTVPVNKPHFNVWAEADSLSLTFSGSTAANKAYIEFHLRNLNIKKFEDLLQLEGQKITLDGNTNAGFYYENANESAFESRGVGQIYFKEVSIDSTYTRAILSGTFGFSVKAPEGRTIKVSSGRFDYRFYDNENFNLRPEW